MSRSTSYNHKTKALTALVVAGALALTACGGGGAGDSAAGKGDEGTQSDPPVIRTPIPRADRCDEVRIIVVKTALHLFQETLLVLRQRHEDSLRCASKTTNHNCMLPRLARLGLWLRVHG